MNKTPKPNMALAVLLLSSLAFAAIAPAGQMDQRVRQSTGRVDDSLEAILRDLKAYDTSDVGPAMRLRDYVFSNKDNGQARSEIEDGLLRFIQSSPAPAGLMAACRALSLVGGTDSVAVLAGLALKPETSDAARYALERIPGGEADQALLAALDKAQGEVRRGVVFSLGARKSTASVAALARLAGGKDTILAGDAVKALGKIGDPEAVRALTASLKTAGSGLRPEIASALLLAAEGRLDAGDKPGALAIYDPVFAANVSAVSRQAAFRGKIAAGPDAKRTILKALAGKDTLLHAPALAGAPASFGPGEIGEVADSMARLPVESRIQLAALLACYPTESVLPFLLSAAEDASLEVRLAALRSLAAAGNGRAVIFLATKAARTSGAEQDAARDALARLKGSDVDEAVLAHLAKAPDAGLRAELIQAVGARRIGGAKPALIDMVRTGPAEERSRAAAALRTISGQADIPALLDLLGGLEDETAREVMGDTIAAVARRNPRELARAGEVRGRLAVEKAPKRRADLFRVLGKIGDDSTLSLVRAALADPNPEIADAAVRAVADWPTATARDDAFEVARSATVLTHRVLAVRAYVRMVGLEPNRAPQAAAGDLARILAVAPRPEEKKLVLGALVRFPCPAALKTAESLLADPAVAEEAKLAVDRIRKTLK